MSETIYFSEVQFKEISGGRYSYLVLNLIKRELSYQVFTDKAFGGPTIQGTHIIRISGTEYNYDFSESARIISNSKTDFNKVLLPDQTVDCKLIFSYSKKLKPKELSEIKSLCNALDFEPYRDRKMSTRDEGYIGYRDTIQLYFTGITESYIPIMEWNMKYIYDDKHIWPSDKLYMFLLKKFFEGNKETEHLGLTYLGGCLLLR